MKLIIKQDGTEYEIEVLPTTQIIDIKCQIAFHLNIPVDNQTLLFLGCTLSNHHKIENYPNIKDGCKLDLVIKKPERLFDSFVKHFKNKGKSDDEAKVIASRLLDIMEEKIHRMSEDELKILEQDCSIYMYEGSEGFNASNVRLLQLINKCCTTLTLENLLDDTQQRLHNITISDD